MKHGTRKYKQVPYRMGIGHLFVGIKNRAHGISHTASGDEHQFGQTKAFDQRWDQENGQPAHTKIEDKGKFGKPMGIKHLEQDPQQGQPPDYAEKYPTPPATQSDQQEWRVSAGNQKVDADMVENPQQGLDIPGGDGVIEGGESIKQEDGGPEYATTYHMNGCAVEYRKGDQ